VSNKNRREREEKQEEKLQENRRKTEEKGAYLSRFISSPLLLL
jgi:hypothetical protein